MMKKQLKKIMIKDIHKYFKKLVKLKKITIRKFKKGVKPREIQLKKIQHQNRLLHRKYHSLNKNLNNLFLMSNPNKKNNKIKVSIKNHQNLIFLKIMKCFKIRKKKYYSRFKILIIKLLN